MQLLSVSTIYLPVFGIIFVVITARVGILRVREKLSWGDGGKEDFRKIMRAQMNFSESTPLALLLIVLVEYNSANLQLVQGLFLALLAGRTLHYLQLTEVLKPIAFRMLGMLLTLGTMLIASVWLLLN